DSYIFVKSEILFSGTDRPTAQIAANPFDELRAGSAAATTMDDSGSLSFHSVKCLLENRLIACLAEFLARLLNPFFLERILRRAIGFVECPEYAGEGERGEFVRGELVGDVVPELVLRCAVPSFFLDYFEAAAFFWIGRVEHVREKFDAFRK